jgi:uncharacterized membrane protein YGL010W
MCLSNGTIIMDKNDRNITIERIKPHLLYSISMVLFILLEIHLIRDKPQLPVWEAIQTTYAMFSLALQATILNLIIGIFLYYRWITTNKTNISTRNWAIAFLLNCVFFIGQLFQAQGFSWANMNDPFIFFAFIFFTISPTQFSF